MSEENATGFVQLYRSLGEAGPIDKVQTTKVQTAKIVQGVQVAGTQLGQMGADLASLNELQRDRIRLHSPRTRLQLWTLPRHS